MNSSEAYRIQVQNFLEEHFAQRKQCLPLCAAKLLEAAEYSVFGSGKRFRPLVSLFAAEALQCSSERVLPFASAVELIHTYSLIHDDLPCMDNDDWRRGQPTNHRNYGEAMALLAGDALLTEAFYIIGSYYESTPEVGLALTKLLSEAAGLTGMVAGQVMDITVTENKYLQQDDLLKLHELKTGALIRISAQGVAIIARANPEKTAALTEYGRLLGIAFQLTDDVLDFDPENLEDAGFPKLLGIEDTKRLLARTTQSALNQLEVFGPEASQLRELVEFNSIRKI